MPRELSLDDIMAKSECGTTVKNKVKIKAPFVKYGRPMVIRPVSNPSPFTRGNEFMMFPSLRSKHVHIKDEKLLLKTISTILRDGPNILQIVTDFDLTLTKQHVDGKNVLSSFGIFSKCKQLPETYSKEATYLYKKYRPIEINPNLSIETKVEAMNEWMIASENLIKGVPFKAQEIMEVARIYGTDLRNGTKELLEMLNSKEIPVLVFSAGLGDIVEAILMQNNILLDNVKIISNFLKYENEKLAGFENERKIHVFNKNEHAIEQNYFKLLEGRKNVFLMGDNIGDAFMVDGMTDTCAVLKIGFLYDNVEDCLPFYLEVFDIVLVDDQTMEVPTSILQRLL